MGDIIFDAQRLADDLIKVLIAETDVCVKQFISEVQRSLTDGKDACIAEKAELVIENGTQHIIGRAKFLADAILDSYGVGSLADTSKDSYWDEWSTHPLFNKSRKGTAIVGRPRGSYIDPWGKQHSTWGGMEGINIEGMTFENEDGSTVTIEPKSPSYAIQNAEKWIANRSDSWIERRLSVAAKKFIMENSFKYFRN